jgi:hypothetical protein
VTAMTSRPVETDSRSPKDDLSLELSEAFAAFEGIQADFLRALRERPNSVLAQLHRWEEGRHRGSAVLRLLLERLQEALQSGDCSRQEGEMWQGRLAQVMEKEGEIYAALAQERLRLEDELKKLSRGKRALKGYRSESPDRRPVFCCQDV